METQQIVVQLLSAPEVRALVQKGNDPFNVEQVIVMYEDLTPTEKATWDAFVAMLNSK